MTRYKARWYKIRKQLERSLSLEAYDFYNNLITEDLSDYLNGK